MRKIKQRKGKKGQKGKGEVIFLVFSCLRGERKIRKVE